ncbi:hypothetical protein FACS1894218_0980 [Bacilli bacterium]|nr:hypothetical protein FACS1894218_0980 [Bacilli bacterium]
MTCFGVNYAIQTHLVDDINQAKTNYQQIVREAVDRFEPGERQVGVFFDGKFRSFTN